LADSDGSTQAHITVKWRFGRSVAAIVAQLGSNDCGQNMFDPLTAVGTARGPAGGHYRSSKVVGGATGAKASSTAKRRARRRPGEPTLWTRGKVLA